MRTPLSSLLTLKRAVGLIPALSQLLTKKWKGKGKEKLERIDKEEEEEILKERRIEEWDKEDEMGKIGDLYNKL